MRQIYNLGHAPTEGVIGAVIMTIVSIFASFVYLHYPSGISTSVLYVGINAIVIVIGLFFFNYSLSAISEKYNEDDIGTYTLAGTMLIMIAIVTGGILSPSSYGSKLVTLVYVIAWLIGYWAYSVSLNYVGTLSKLSLFKYAGFVLFLSVLLLYYTGPLLTEVLQSLGWLLTAVSFIELKTHNKKDLRKLEER